MCNKKLDCGEHNCERTCHSNDCGSCALLPKNLKYCPCGKTTIDQLVSENNNNARLKCTDLIPTCNKLCNKLLSCSNFDNDELHYCQSMCHHGECLKCDKTVRIKCRCGNEAQELPCYEAQKYKTNPLLCSKRCSKKKSCGKHKCSEECCDNEDHICTVICNRLLSCGQHKCENLCHKGNCPKCLVASK